MKNKKILFTLLFVALYVHSEDITFADATYCFDFVSREGVELVLIKENRHLEIRTPEEYWNMPCGPGYVVVVSTDTDILNGFRKSVMPNYAVGTASGCFDGDSTDIRRLQGLPRVIPLAIELNLARWPELQKEEALRFSGQIIDAYMTASVECKPGFDTTYIIKFRAEITGECDKGFLNKRKKNR